MDINISKLFDNLVQNSVGNIILGNIISVHRLLLSQQQSWEQSRRRFELVQYVRTPWYFKRQFYVSESPVQTSKAINFHTSSFAQTYTFTINDCFCDEWEVTNSIGLLKQTRFSILSDGSNNKKTAGCCSEKINVILAV